jgi:phosphoglycerate kinase
MKFFKQTINTVPLHGETVLVRADYNVPLKKDGSIGDDFRIRSSIPTIKKLLASNCKVVIVSHLGRPEGREVSLSLEPIAMRLAELLGESIRFVDQTIGDKPRMAIKRAPKRSVTVLENLRFHSEEEANDETFARALAKTSGARYFVQDGFGVVHRAHASTSAITLFLPSVAGLLLEREYMSITTAMKTPKQPLVAVMGGAKVSDKITVIKAFVEVADKIIIGGAMANTFLVYKGLVMGKSKVEPDEQETLDGIYEAARKKVGAGHEDDFIVLPTDLAVATEIDASQTRRLVKIDEVDSNDIALDIGDVSIEKMTSIIKTAKTVVWSGTLGYAELPEYAHGSARLALAMATTPDLTSIIGGGDTADFALNWDVRKGGSFTLVSTGGSASLELMAGEKLPGIECLLDAPA